MKKLLKGTIVLTAFAIAITVFQMSCTDDVIAKVADYVLPAATTTTLGGVMVDGTTILVDASGKISSTGIKSVNPATPSSLGVVKPDGTSITVDGNGVISAKANGIQQVGKIIYVKQAPKGTNQVGEIWTANYDGTGKSKINITLPTGLNIEDGSSVRVSPDGKRLFFLVVNDASDEWSIYSSNIDGTGAIQVIAADGSTYLELASVY